MYYCPFYQQAEMYRNHGDEDYHTHYMSGNVSVKNDHDHEYEGYSSEEIKEGNSHMHFFRGDTTTEKGHDHRYCGYTGPAVCMPGGQHYHTYSGRTSYEMKHYHDYMGMTSLDIPMKEV